MSLPPVAYDACDKQAGRVSSLSLVRYRTNDYSVPVAYGHRDVLVKGYVDEVVISCGSEVIARHPRSYERYDFVYNPIHYLPLLEQKTGALDQAAPLQGWDLPDEFGTLRRLLESRMGRRGKREYVQVLRLLETFSQQEVAAAVKTQSVWEPSASTLSSTWYCADWRDGRPGWTWNCTPICPGSGSAPRPPKTT